MTANKPDYLQQTAIYNLLNRFLNRLDRLSSEQREQRVTEKIKEKYFPNLFDPQQLDDDTVLWRDLQQLSYDAIINIEAIKPRVPINTPEWENSRLVFNVKFEEQLRFWLNRPVQSAYDTEWHHAVIMYQSSFAKPDLLASPLFEEWGKSATDVVQRLAKIPEVLDHQAMTLYQLSAHLFWANSKLIKDKGKWFQELFALGENQLLPRPLLLDITFPRENACGILLIENLDSYFAAVAGRWQGCENLILIYTQGFKIAAHRIRNRDCINFHINSQHLPVIENIRQFEKNWFGQEKFPYPVYMITDLDWSGMSIYYTTCQNLPELEPWINGYLQMLGEVEQNNYHSPKDAQKNKQRPILSSGNKWLDDNVIPILKQHCFVDQEVIM